MLQKLIDWVKRLFGIKTADAPSGPDRYAEQYEDVSCENITAKISNKLATMVFSDSSINVDGTGQRAELIRRIIQNLLRDADWITAQAFGKGGKVIVPVVNGEKLQVTPMDQRRMSIRRIDDGKIMEATLVYNCTVQDDKRYYLLADYNVDDNGLQTIRFRVVSEDGSETEKSAIKAWANIDDEISISGTDRALFAFLPCPRDNRKDDKKYGVPITYGAETEVNELIEHAKIYSREYKLTRAMLGLDSTLWRRRGDKDKATPKPISIDDIKKTVQDSDEPFIPVDSSAMDPSTPWLSFSPNIRYEAMEGRYNSLSRRVEKACGLSQGILTERQNMNYANKDEVRAAMYDTFCVVRAMRDNWQRALEDIAYATDVLAERFGLTPAGSRDSYEIQYDWDTSLIESSAEAFTQTMEGHAAGVISDAELRQWLRGGTLDEAKKAVEEIRKEKRENNPMDGFLARMRGGDIE